MKKDSHRNNLLSSETKENSNKVTNDLNSESFKIDQLRDFYLQNQWSLKTNSELLTIIDPIPTHKTIFQSFIPNSYIWISSENDLKDVWHNIASAKVLGIDIEQTFHQSYFGYICLIQISTPNTDYIFDVIALRKSIRDYLQAILENPLIVKIFYSGENDLFWLKRDFSISVINYFDIKTAALFLNKTMDCSLVNLIETFCEIGKMDKKNKKILQVSNWFERPLTIEQLNYAAMDSHYLIYLREKLLGSIFEKIKNLKQIISFFELMEATSKKKYQQKVFNNSEFYELFNRLFKANKIILLKKKNDLEEEKKFESEEKSNNDKKQMQFYFIKLAEMRDKYARMKNVGIEEICSTDGLFHLSKKTIVSLPEDIIKSIDLQEKDMNFVKMNLKEIAEIFKTKNEEIIEEIEKISRSNKVQTNLHNEKRKQDRMKQISELFSRKSPAYENCSILAPDGYMLCHCDQKKINWYLARSLAVPVTPDKKTIQLTFEPQGRGFSELEYIDHKFYTVDRNNQCVVCGHQEKYLKYHIVPSLYRQNFPNSFKSHRSHDVVLLCLECHELANKETEKLKIEIAEKFDCPLSGNNNPLSILRNKLIMMAKCGLSYWKNKEVIPKDRRKILKQELRNFFDELGKEEKIQKFIENDEIKLIYNKKNLIKIDKNFFQMCQSFTKKNKNLKDNSNKDFKNMHGKIIVEKFTSNQELKDFILMWRKNFIDKLKPKFLPQAWNVYHQFERDFGEFSKFHEGNSKKK